MQIRLALREEGNFWNAYISLAHTMENAKLIGSIAIGAAKKNPAVKTAFQALMQQVLSDAIKDMTGKEPSKWDMGPAPEAERAGHG